MSESGVDYDEVSFVIRSDTRTTVIEQLARREQTPSGIEAVSKYDVTHVSRALQELRDRDLVELLVSEDVQKGRIYGLTDSGESVAEYANEIAEVVTDGGETDD